MGGSTAYADGVPGGNISNAAVRAVDIAKPAVVRVFTSFTGEITVKFSNGQAITFPQTSQNGSGYPLEFSGTGTFISAHGDILTADHVMNPVQDDRNGVDQDMDQTAAQDIANYMNQNLNLSQTVSPDDVTQELQSGQLQSTTQYQKATSQVCLSTDFTGPLTASNLESLPAGDFASVDQIKAQSPFNDRDVAIIHVSGMDNMAMVQLGDSSAVQEQDQLTIIGFPGNGDVTDTPTDLLTSSINTVMVSSIKAATTDSPLIQVGGNVEQGDSGGPALDSQGHVVGIVSFGVEATSGSTSFLRASVSAQQLMTQANINTAPSAFQQAWSKAFNDYSSTAAGHWHLATQEFQQIANLYPQFKAVSQFLQYASQQAKTEKSSQGSSSTSPSTVSSPSSSINPMYIIAGGAIVLLIVLVGGGVLASRRRKPAMAPMAGYSSMPSQPNQNAPLAPTQPPMYQQPQAYGTQVSAPPSGGGYRSPVPVTPQPIPTSGVHSQTANGLGAFGGPSGSMPSVPATPAPGRGTGMAFPPQGNGASVQWRTWPCGHVNRSDARFCGICGEPTPPLVRRVEQ